MGNPDPQKPHGETSLAADINLVQAAQDANAQEHNLTFREAVKLYPKSVMWSVAFSTMIIMEGYDTKLMGTLYAQPTFQRAYGVSSDGESYQIPASWQAGLGNGSAVGQLIGLLIAGYVSERFGFRKTALGGMLVVIAFIFILFFATSLQVLLVGQVLFGIPLGLFQTIPVIYALEISPMCLRAYLTNYVTLCWAFGQLTCVGVLRGVLDMKTQWAYRLPFALQWVWPIIMIPILILAPESPWWLVRNGRIEDARAVLNRITSARNINYNIDQQIALMEVTIEQERSINAETTYKACFQGTNLRRTLVGIGIYAIQTLNGNPLRGWSTYFFQSAGMPTTEAFNMTIVGFALAIAGGLSSLILLPLAGRRTLYVWSLVLMLAMMIVIGGLGVPQAQSSNTAYGWGIGSVLVISSFLFYATIGPLTNTLCGEIPTAILRSKSLVLARWVYTVTGVIAAVLTPYQLNPTAWNWGAKTGFFYAGGCVISVVFAFFFVPETKNRTTAEIDALYARNILERHFAKTPVDVGDAVHGELDEKSG